jgi:acyl-CoA synthetase (AMP-forming)/AMP-acid ligase II
MATLSNSFSPDSPSPAVIIPTGTGGAGTTISYAHLHSLISNFQRRLAFFGISAHSAVSIALPNNLEFIVSFLAVAAQRSIAAPLNPTYKQAEFEFYIDDIKSALVIVPLGAVKADAPAVRAAAKFGAGVAEVWWDAAKGEVQVELVVQGKLKGDAGLVTAQSEDVALVLHTSGTTGRPKAVPLSHRNLTRTMGMFCAVCLGREADDGREYYEYLPAYSKG